MIIKSDKGISVEGAIAFFRENRNKLGRIVKVKMERCVNLETQEPEDYPFRLIDRNGNEMWIAGLTSGSIGEGSTGVLTILREGCERILFSYGITIKQFEVVVFESPSFTIS
jgi:hypothetical protein